MKKLVEWIDSEAICDCSFEKPGRMVYMKRLKGFNIVPDRSGRIRRAQKYSCPECENEFWIPYGPPLPGDPDELMKKSPFLGVAHFIAEA